MGSQAMTQLCSCGDQINPALLGTTHWADHADGCPQGTVVAISWVVHRNADGEVLSAVRSDGVELACTKDRLRDAYRTLISHHDDPTEFESAAARYEDCRNGYVFAAIADLVR